MFTGACYQSVNGKCRIDTAAGGEQVAAMEKLVELGADVAVIGYLGGAVHAAARGGSVEGIDAAVRLGADPRAVDRNGMTAFQVAAASNQPGGMDRLGQLGVPIDAVDNDGRTALYWAYLSPTACRTLLELGADRWIEAKWGGTARDVAVRDQYHGGQAQQAVQQVVELLDTYWPIVPCMAQLLLGLRGPSESSLTRFAAHTAFEPKVLSLVNCLLTGKDDKAFAQLVSES